MFSSLSPCSYNEFVVILDLGLLRCEASAELKLSLQLLLMDLISGESRKISSACTPF